MLANTPCSDISLFQFLAMGAVDRLSARAVKILEEKRLLIPYSSRYTLIILSMLSFCVFPYAIF